MGNRWNSGNGGYDNFEWDYYSENNPRKVEGGIKARSERGAIGETWWSKRWVQALEKIGIGNRLVRGRSYARQGQVLSIEIESGLVEAKVQGSMKKPYSVKIQLHPFSKRDWQQVITVMASQALFAAKLLAGEMPKNIEDAFDTANLSLFPEVKEDLRTSCSCPDPVNPCKHIAATYYILAERFDEDPFLLFKLRGRDKDSLITDLREKRNSTLDTKNRHTPLLAERNVPKTDVEQVEATVRLEDSLEHFWQAGDELNTFVITPGSPEVENALLKRLGNAPFAIDGKNGSTMLEKMYEQVHKVVMREE